MAFVQSTPTSATGSGITSLSATFPSTTVSGNSVVAQAATWASPFANGVINTVTDNHANSYTSCGADDEGVNIHLRQFRSLGITGGASHQVTANFAGSCAASIGALEYSNVRAYDQTTIGPGISGSTGSTGAVTPGGRALFVAAMTDGGTGGSRTVTGATQRIIVDPTNANQMLMATDEVAISAQTTTWTSATTYALAVTSTFFEVELEQEGFRFRADDGSESGATWLASQDTGITRAAGETARLRVLLDAGSVGANPASQAFRLEYKKSTDSAYIPVPTSGAIDINYGTEGAVTSGAAGSINVAYPSTIDVGDLLVIVAVNKFQTVTANTPTGFTAPSNNSFAVQASEGTAGAEAVDAGSVRVTLFYRVADGTETAGSNVSVSWSGAADSAMGRMFKFTKPAWATWDIACHGGKDIAGASGAGAWSVTAGSDLGLAMGDMILIASGVNTDAAAWGTHAVSATGATFSALTERLDTGTTTGNDIDLVVVTGDVTAGKATAAPVYTATPSTGTPEGASAFMRIRATGWPAFQMWPSANITAGGEATTAQLTAPSGKTSSDFSTGRAWDDENGSDSVDIGTDGYTELEWALAADAALTPGDVYQFRVTVAGDELTTYTITPQWTIDTAGLCVVSLSSQEWLNDSGTKTHTTHVVPPSANLLLVAVTFDDLTSEAERALSALTWDGTALTKYNEEHDDGSRCASDFYYLLNPAVGPQTLSLTLAGSGTNVRVFVRSLANADETTPIEDWNGTFDASTPSDVTVVTSAVTSLICDVIIERSATAISADASQSNVQTLSSLTGSSTKRGTGGSDTMSWAYTGGGSNGSHSAVAIKAAGGGGSGSITGGTIAAGSTLSAPTLRYVLVGPTRASAATLSAPSLAYRVVGPTISPLTALTAPTVTTGAVTVVGGTIAAASAVQAPSVAYVVVGPTRASTAVLSAPSVAYRVAGATIVSANQRFAPTLAYAVTTAFKSSGHQLFAQTVTSGTTIAGATIASAHALTAPSLAYAMTTAFRASAYQAFAPTLGYQVVGATIAAGNQRFAPSLAYVVVTGTRTTTAQLFEPTITSQGSVAAGTVASGHALYTPTLAYRVVGPTRASGTTLNAPSVQFVIGGATVAATSTTYAPTLAYVVVGPTRTATTTLYSPSLAAGSGPQDVTGATIAAGHALTAPSLAYVLVGPTRGTTTALYSPTAAYAVTTPSFPAGTVLRAPTVTTGAVTIVGGTRGSAVVLYSPTVSFPGTSVGSITLVVPAKSRTVVVDASSRTIVIPARSRTVSIPEGF